MLNVEMGKAKEMEISAVHYSDQYGCLLLSGQGK